MAMTRIRSSRSATIYRARQPAFDREVAVKVFADDLDDPSRTRFERECSALGALSGHPNIVTLYEMDRAEDGRLFLVMEFLSGGSLGDLLDGYGPIHWPATLEIGVKLAGALESAHRADVIHGDVTPQNILLSRFGEPKLGDFGLSGIAGEIGTPGGVAGTLAHAAPEVAAGGRPTVAGDVYGLASTLHTLISGQPPFVRGDDVSLVSLVGRLSRDAPPDLRNFGSPDQLCRVLEQGMAKAPIDRQSGAAQLGRQLQAVQAHAGLPITPMVFETETAEAATEPVQPPVGGKTIVSNRQRQWVRVAHIVGGLLIAVAMLSWLVPERTTTVRLSQVFQDDFEAGQGWYEHRDPIATLGYQDGRYQLIVEQPRHQVISDTAFRGPVYGTSLTNLRDVSVRVSARASSDSGLLGVVCRQAPGAAHYYEGLVGVDGTARIVKFDGRNLITLATAPIAPVGQRVTRLRLDCLGEPHNTRIRLFADNRLLVEATERQGYGGGSTGLVLVSADAPRAEAVFDDFVILGQATDQP